LRVLDLSGTQVRDLSPLSSLRNLRTLKLSRTDISDLVPLAGLQNLEFLSLDSTPASDLNSLAGLTKNLSENQRNAVNAGDDCDVTAGIRIGSKPTRLGSVNASRESRSRL
jgi:Leucine-rich repeat (LRR) protein